MSASLTVSPLSFRTSHGNGYFHGSHPSSEQQPSLTTHTVNSRDLLQGQKTVDISHNGTIYRLQATRLGKLILTK